MLSKKEQEIFEGLLSRYPVLCPCHTDLQDAYLTLRECYERGRKLLICGNGGSAADADHISAELLKAFRCKRPIPADIAAKLPENIAQTLQGSLPAIPLTDLIAIQTAFANDCQPELGFAQLVLGLGNQSDVLLAISTSGNSKSVNAAAIVARAKNMKVVGLSGKTGGQLLGNCDVCVCAPECETYKIQELHLPIYHAWCAMLESFFFDSTSK